MSLPVLTVFFLRSFSCCKSTTLYLTEKNYFCWFVFYLYLCIVVSSEAGAGFFVLSKQRWAAGHNEETCNSVYLRRVESRKFNFSVAITQCSSSMVWHTGTCIQYAWASALLILH